MSDIVTSRIFTDGEKGITATKLNDIIGSSVIQPAFYSAKSTASTADAADTLLLLKAAGSYAQVPVSTFVTSVAGQLPSSDAEIWSVRLRSYNSVGNPNFEADQRNCGNVVTINAGTVALVDRWFGGIRGASAMRFSAQQQAENIVIPGGTSYFITSRFLRITLTTAQASLASNDFAEVWQNVEGPYSRELFGDNHSSSLLVRSSVANLKFGLCLADSPGTHILTKLCSLGAAGTWTLISLPNLPVWGAGGAWAVAPGALGYLFQIVLAAGSGLMAPANDTWQTSSTMGAIGQSNFAASTLGSTFDVAFCQHEPGPVCSTLMDKPFTQNLDECLRYYQKSYDYSILPGTATSNGMAMFQANNGWTSAWGTLRFQKPMAKIPGVRIWNPVTGAGDAARGVYANTNFSTSAGLNIGTSGFSGFNISPAASAEILAQFHYTADTGW